MNSDCGDGDVIEDEDYRQQRQDDGTGERIAVAGLTSALFFHLIAKETRRWSQFISGSENTKKR